ncbi:glycosyltransferase [Frigoriglobus tundricola]|uniref:Uncharacterized protein n=1 Tax=Frigoriglobus tundricola TaxID=2774151 RepID=A0A6M5YXX2_9BACT|nr:glycosyltransferase [Frigoriglobus tundricola]QJW98053.1 hypothetical protein FTUN_5633 [Frigoriglobus tundricola]
MHRTLALIPYVPHPPFGGGDQRVHHVLTALAGAGELVVWALSRHLDQPDGWPLAARFAERPRVFSHGAPGAASEPAPPLTGLFNQPFPTWPGRVRADYSHALWAALERLDLGGFSAVHVESLGMIPYGVALRARHPRLRLTLNVDNIDPVYAWQALRVAPRWFSRPTYWAVRNIAQLFRFSRRWFPAFDAVWVCSGTDRRWVLRWTNQRRVVVVPNGMDCAMFSDLDPAPDCPRLVMTGTMMEGPNSDGMAWFADRVWPEVLRAVPGAEFWCVGRDPCPPVLEAAQRHPGITVTGSVPDVRPYLARAAVSVAPVRYGTGTRLKILEAMAAGLPVVSTRLGADGLGFRHGRELLLADRAGDFANACIRLLTDAGARTRLGATGRRSVQKYDWKAIYQTISSLAAAGAERAPGARAPV